MARFARHLGASQGPREPIPRDFFAVCLGQRVPGAPTTEWLEFLPSLKEIINRGHSIQDRVRAARAVAQATSTLRNRELALGMLVALNSINVSDQDFDSKSHIGLARALLLFQAGHMEDSYQLADSLSEGASRAWVGQLDCIAPTNGVGGHSGTPGTLLGGQHST